MSNWGKYTIIYLTFKIDKRDPGDYLCSLYVSFKQNANSTVCIQERRKNTSRDTDFRIVPQKNLTLLE